MRAAGRGSTSAMMCRAAEPPRSPAGHGNTDEGGLGVPPPRCHASWSAAAILTRGHPRRCLPAHRATVPIGLPVPPIAPLSTYWQVRQQRGWRPFEGSQLRGPPACELDGKPHPTERRGPTSELWSLSIWKGAGTHRVWVRNPHVRMGGTPAAHGRHVGDTWSERFRNRNDDCVQLQDRSAYHEYKA